MLVSAVCDILARFVSEGPLTGVCSLLSQPHTLYKDAQQTKQALHDSLQALHLREDSLLHQFLISSPGHALGGLRGGGPPPTPLAHHPVPACLSHVSSYHTYSVVST